MVKPTSCFRQKISQLTKCTTIRWQHVDKCSCNMMELLDIPKVLFKKNPDSCLGGVRPVKCPLRFLYLTKPNFLIHPIYNVYKNKRSLRASFHYNKIKRLTFMKIVADKQFQRKAKTTITIH